MRLFKILISLRPLCLASLISMPIQGAEQYSYQIFPNALVVLDDQNIILLDRKNKNFGQLGQYKFSLDGTGFAKLKATDFILAKVNSSERYVLLTGNISVKYKSGIDVNLLAQDYALSVSSHFPNIRRVYLRTNTAGNLQDLKKQLLLDSRVLKARLDMIDFNQWVR